MNIGSTCYRSMYSLFLIAATCTQLVAQTSEQVAATIILQHSSDVSAAVFTPDGNHVVTCTSGQNPTINIWNAHTGGLDTMISKSNDILPVSWMQFDSDGKTLIAGKGGRGLLLWNVSTWDTIRSIRKDVIVVGGEGALSPDGSMVALGGQEGFPYVWDRKTDSLKKLPGIDADYSNQVGVRGYMFSRDGSLLMGAVSTRGEHLSGGDFVWHKRVHIWNTKDLSLQGTFEIDARGHLYAPRYGVAFTNDGKSIIAGHAHVLAYYDAKTYERTKGLLPTTGSVASISLDPQGTFAALGVEDHYIEIWDIANAKSRGLLQAHDASIRGLIFSPDGTRVLSWGGTTARIWNVADASGVPPSTRYAGDSELTWRRNGEVLEIDYVVGRRGHARLVMFDMLGREIATLFDGETEAGRCHASLDVSSIPSGLYGCLLVADGVQRTVMIHATE